MTDYQKAAIKYAFSDLDAKCNYVISALNTVAGRVASDTKDVLFKRKDLWRHDIKYNATRTIEEIEKNEQGFTQHFGDRYQLFLSYLDCVEEIFKKHTDTLTFSIMQVFTRHNQSDSALKAKVEATRVMLQYACQFFDRLMEIAQEETGIDFKQIYQEKRLTKAYFHWCNVTAAVCKTEGEVFIDLNADPNCRLSFQIIERLMVNEETLDRASFNALEANPQLIGKAVTLEKYEELRQRFTK